MKLLEDLNPQQREAVVNTEGPILVLSGAGSGKTRVLTHKVAYILAQGLAKPWEIMAVTFTNKAAAEMKERIERLTGGETERMWVGTFHSLFARIMRRYADRLDYGSDFAIYDREDQERLMKQALAEMPFPVEAKAYKRMVYRVSGLKSRLQAPTPGGGWTELDKSFPLIFETYERLMKRNNALDFDDLLIKPLELLSANPDIAGLYQERFRYILVDEFQDTNIPQNELVKILWVKHKNLTVVGDDDQSIYGWRGAEIDNILSFSDIYPKAKIYRLEKNYRSTTQILSAAQSVIEHNLGRHGKTLWTDRAEGDKPRLISAWNAREEAAVIADTIESLALEGLKHSNIAILYRVNAQSRALEAALRERKIPYTIVGGLKFYQRKEIKDALAYLRLTVNFSDGVSLLRVVNFPPRGIGATTIKRLTDYARGEGLDLWEALQKVDDISEIKSGAAKKLKDFVLLLSSLKSKRPEVSFPELVKLILDKTKMMEHYLKIGDEEAFVRMDNLKEFMVGVEEYARSNPERTLEDFLGEVALVTDVDEWQAGDMVNLMTVHCAKGLEFPVVFISGLEDGLFPLIRDGRGDLEEERRLFYVGVTRAMDRLYFAHTQTRREGLYSDRSRFLGEIPPEMLDNHDSTGGYRAAASSENRGQRPLSAQPPSQSVSDKRFGRGDRVYHKTFGEGIVSACEGSGDEEKVMVYFQGFGAKKLMVKHAGLKRV